MTGDHGRATRGVRLFWRFLVALNLVWFGPPVTDLVGGGHGVTRTVVGAVALVVFAGVYLPTVLAAVDVPEDAPVPWARLVLCVGIGLAMVVLIGPYWTYLLGYTGYLAGCAVRPRRLAVATGAVVALLCAATAWATTGVAWFALLGLAPTVLVLIGAGLSWLVRTCRELDRARGETARLAVADERLRFARDLHDLLGHSLSVIALKSELAGRLAATDPERTAGELRDIEQVTREALAEVRAAVTGYRAECGLAAELHRARQALTAAGVDARVEVPHGALPASVDELFAWTVREATTNVVRHAAASRCTIRVHAGEDTDRVEVVDDGVGGALRCAATGGHGLNGLAERVTAVRGVIETGDAPGGGFALAVRVPR